jgi:transmembrane protein 222
VGDRGRMAFGAPTRYIRVPVVKLLENNNGVATPGELWDEAIQAANALYRTRMHNICCDNCHSHVSNALNRLPPTVAQHFGIKQWNMVNLAAYFFFRGHFRSYTAVYQQFGPFFILVLVIVLTSRLL